MKMIITMKMKMRMKCLYKNFVLNMNNF